MSTPWVTATWDNGAAIAKERGVWRYIPMWAPHVWALADARAHGQRFVVTSAIRTDAVITRVDARWHEGLHSQQYLYDHQNQPGFYPANPPDRSSHCGYADGNPVYGPPGTKLSRAKWGIDAVSDGRANDCSPLVAWLNQHGYHAVRPYPTTSEAHHLSFVESPVTNARARHAPGAK
jgi:hypothetical protein